jgi:hypothetical protein
MQTYKIPNDFKKIWKAGKREFQIWNALYYLSQVRFNQEEFVVTPYIIRNAPFLITDIKINSLFDQLIDLENSDSNISFDKGYYRENKKFLVKVNIPDDCFEIPVELTEYSLFKGNDLKIKKEIPALLYLFKNSVPDESKPGFYQFEITGSGLSNFVSELSGKKNNSADIIEKFRNIDMLEYSKNLKEDTFKGTLKWVDYANKAVSKSLKVKAGTMPDEVCELLGRFATNEQYLDKTHFHDSTDRLIIASTLGSLGKTPVEMQCIDCIPGQIVDKISNDINETTNAGRFLLQNKFTCELESRNIFTKWLDFSITRNTGTRTQEIVLPEINLKFMLLKHYIYKGSQIYTQYNKIDYGIRAELCSKNSSRCCKLLLGHDHNISFNDKILDGYRGPYLCRFQNNSNRFDTLNITVEPSDSFKKLTLRVLVILIPDIV